MVFFVFSDLLGMVFRLDGSVLFALKGGTLCEMMQTELGSHRRKRPRKEFKLKQWGGFELSIFSASFFCYFHYLLTYCQSPRQLRSVNCMCVIIPFHVTLSACVDRRARDGAPRRSLDSDL